ncbi:mitochondrial carrier domain-containing protein [Tricharina praecox]|uniref:mitochondrial carrier domain-containing protein n=1 Tax=Tricharina praecox TaxID=43433 RepID=UPI002220E0A8|nr:mitochondrial carrier domain-containing protein [Tricharina praecox]XP_051336926.1 mitochondrial carrier domain-containing protein [Tricharina praecox]KAI5841260.1 mitochondrial carrier domain-containing protein [Tricharina praecox]KAI5846720.1 mitochondrial carrier domain-containing protein [Tricharina praecox]
MDDGTAGSASTAANYHNHRKDNHSQSAMVRNSTLELEDIPGARIRGDGHISATQRMLAACSGSLLTSLLVTPLDVVRVRLQAQHPAPAQSSSSLAPHISSDTLGRARSLPLSPIRFQSTAALSTPELGVTACCREVFWVGNTAEACLASPTIPTALTDSCIVEQTSSRRFSGTWEGLVKIARYEGLSSLWRGLSPTLLMSVPSNVIYFTGYDWLRTSDVSPFSSLGGVTAPLLAGSAARAIAASVISPLELFKTRLQATSNFGFQDTLHGIRTMVHTEGALTLWRGLGLTLWRDVPFSGIYWLGYERIKERLRTRREAQWSLLHDHPTGILLPSAQSKRKEDLHAESTFLDAFIAGASSGAVAAFLTTPYDVGKTRRQIAHARGQEIGAKAMSMPKVLFEIWREGGLQGLWKGCTPRMLKVAPACAIMISSYEVCKKAAMRVNHKNNREL